MKVDRYYTGTGTWKSSGAAYGGDPQNVLRCWSICSTLVAKPKSPTLTLRSDAVEAKNTFSAFRSLKSSSIFVCNNLPTTVVQWACNDVRRPAIYQKVAGWAQPFFFLPVNEKSVVHVVDRRCNLGKYNFGLWGLSVWPLFARQSSKQLATVGIFHDQV